MTRKKMIEGGKEETGRKDDESRIRRLFGRPSSREVSSNYGGYTTIVMLLVIVSAWVSPTTHAQYANRGLATTTGVKNNGKQFLPERPPSNPPTVRPPPYFNSLKSCQEANDAENWQGNLCGDLNTGEIPVNPLGHQDFPGDSRNYPFELIKNKTLEFFRHALPVLKTYKSLPKVARYVYPSEDPYYSTTKHSSGRRRRRGLEEEAALKSFSGEQDESGSGRGFGGKRAGSLSSPLSPYGSPGRRTDAGTTRVKRTHAQPKTPTHYYGNGYGGNNLRQYRGGPSGTHCENVILCKLFNSMYEKLPSGFQRLVSASGDGQQKRHGNNLQGQKSIGQLPHVGSLTISSSEQLLTDSSNHLVHGGNKKQGELEIQGRMIPPQTPCPSSAEYLTPVFARNHEGAWRYVVQIPREGYFTQTVEVTKCIQSNCLFLEGTCRSSPRWQSLLVAEMYYPDAIFPVDSHLQTPKELQYHERRGSGGDDGTLTTNDRMGAPQTDIEDDSDEIHVFNGRMKRNVRNDAKPAFPRPPHQTLLSEGPEDAGSLGRRKTRSNNRENYGKKKTGNEAVYKEGRFYEGKQGVNNSSDQLVTANHVSESKHCDGYDDIGCYQFRLFYDWFLIPGECKCWRRPHPFY